MYLLEFAGEDDALAAREAASAASGLERIAPGLAVATAIVPDRARGLAFTRRASDLVGRTDASIESARVLLETAGIGREGTIAVRATDVRGESGVSTARAERVLGQVLVDRGFSVDLEDPDHVLRAAFSTGTLSDADPVTASTGRSDADALEREMPDNRALEGDARVADALEGGPLAGDSSTRETAAGERVSVCALGWLAVESVRDFAERAPTDKPFFQPGSMDPLLARAVANLAGARPGATILDPMCGTGGGLVEAGLVGADVVGTDAQPKMVRGARTNLAQYLESAGGHRDSPVGVSTGTWEVARADATRLPFADGAIDGVVFDAPYGRQSKIETHELADLVAGALAEARRVADRAVVVADRSWAGPAREAGWELAAAFERRVHRSLTRYVLVLD